MMNHNTAPNDFISRSQLAAWGLLDQVIRLETMDTLLQHQPSLSPAELEPLTMRWCQEHNISSGEELTHWRHDHGLSLEQWQQLIMRPKQWMRWCKQEFKGRIKTHFLQRKTHLDRVIYSLIRVKDEELSWELFQRIKEEEACFRQLASEHSEGHERNCGGLLGPVPLSQPHPHLSELLRISEPGKLWPPKKLEGWWVIVRLEQRLGARLGDLSEHLALELGELHINSLIEKSHAQLPSKAVSSGQQTVRHGNSFASQHTLNKQPSHHNSMSKRLTR